MTADTGPAAGARSSRTADVVVLGGGAAGTAAALAARRAGATVLVVEAHGAATSLAGGAWDIASPPRGTLDDVFRPARTIGERVATLQREYPHHPYARIAPNALDAIRAAHDLVLPGLGLYRPIDLDGPGMLVATDIGMLRRTATAQRAVLDLSAARGAVAVAVLRGYREYDGVFVAASLSDMADRAGDDRRFGAIDVEFLRRRSDALLHAHEIASVADTADGRARLVAMLARAVAGAGFAAILLPALLGITDGGIALALEKELGVPVGEVVAPLAGAQSLRLRRELVRLLEDAGVDRRHAIVERVAIAATGTRIRLAGGDDIRGGATVLATGKLVGGGIAVHGGEPVEPLAGLTIYSGGQPLPLSSSGAGRDPIALFGADLFAGGPGFRQGAGYDETLRALDRDGKPVGPSDLFVAGALLDGFDPARDGTGLGCAVTTGYLAGKNAAARAGGG